MNDLERILSLAGVKYQSPVEEQTPAVEREYKEGAGADICDHCGCDINNPAQGCTCDHDVEESSCGSKKKHKHEAVSEETSGTIKVNKDIPLAGDSIWFDNDIDSVHVTEITMGHPDDVEGDYRNIEVGHDGPWEIYTDSGFAKEISKIVGFEVDWTEQGMQDTGIASLEGYVDTANEGNEFSDADGKDIPVNKDIKLAGDSRYRKGKNTESVFVTKVEILPRGDEDGVAMADVFVEHDGPMEIYTDSGFEAEISKIVGFDVDWTESGMQEPGRASLEGYVDTANEGNEFSGKRQAAIDAGEDEFEVDDKKYKVTKEADDADYSKDNLELCDDCDMPKDECECDHTNESLEVVEESPTLDTTQLITLLKHSGISEEAINARLAKLEEEFGNTPEGVGETEPTVHGSEDNYNFAQAVNLSLKRYLDAADMKVSVTESHTVEGLKAKYLASKK